MPLDVFVCVVIQRKEAERECGVDRLDNIYNDTEAAQIERPFSFFEENQAWRQKRTQ